LFDGSSILFHHMMQSSTKIARWLTVGLVLHALVSNVEGTQEIWTHDDFTSVLSTANGRPVIIDYYAQSCMPCSMIAPVFQQLSVEYSGRAIFAKVDVMKNQDTPRRQGITGMPTFQFFLNGEMVHSFMVADESQLRSWTEKIVMQAEQLAPAPKSPSVDQKKAQSVAPTHRGKKIFDLESVSMEDLQDELDQRAEVNSKKKEEQYRRNPCIRNRLRTQGQNIEKVVIIGAGPAGASAAIYTGRANLCPLVIAPMLGGQLMAKGVDVENYPGLPGENGAKMVEVMKRQARASYAEFLDDSIVAIDSSTRPFVMTTRSGRIVKAQSLIVATGAESRWLHIDGEYEYRGHGVSGCATCDGFLFKGKPCAVIGGGDTAMEEALVLSRLCSGVTLIHRRDKFRASHAMQTKVFENPKISVHFNTEVLRFGGEEVQTRGRVQKVLTHLELGDTQNPTAKPSKLVVDAAFVAIGHDPNTRFLKGNIDMDEIGYLTIRTGSTHTSQDGIFAAGDVADRIYQQAITSSGSGAMAALDAERYLSDNPLEESCSQFSDMSTWKMKDIAATVEGKGLTCVGCYKKSDYIEMLQMSC